LFHIATAAAWHEARVRGEYAADSLATEGFIHCSQAHQVTWVANARFRGRTDLVLLQVDPAKVTAPVRYENLEGGEELFPHVYGPISLDAVVEVLPLTPEADGSFTPRARRGADNGPEAHG
jgi:uncharacterized protein (DUF952 family)